MSCWLVLQARKRLPRILPSWFIHGRYWGIHGRRLDYSGSAHPPCLQVMLKWLLLQPDWLNISITVPSWLLFAKRVMAVLHMLCRPVLSEQRD